MKNKLIQLLTLCGVLFCHHIAYAAVTFTGKIQYTRQWQQALAGSLVQAADIIGVRPLQKVYVSATCNSPLVCSGGLLGETFTDANGNWSMTYNGTITGGASGTYKVRITYQALNSDTGGSTGYRLVDSVENPVGSGSWQPTTTKLKATYDTAVLGTTGTVNTGTKTFSGTGPENRFSNAFDLMRYEVERWRFLTLTNIGTLVPGTNFEAAVAQVTGFTDKNPTSQCGFADGTAACFNFDTLSADNMTGWHEMGHALLEALMKQFNGVGAWVFTGFSVPGGCAPPSTSGGVGNDTGSAQITEAWANVSALFGFYNIGSLPEHVSLSPFVGFFAGTFDDIDSTLNNCQSCEFAPNLASMPTPPACGSGSVTRSEARGMKILIDLMDNFPSGNSSCLSENITQQPNQVLAAIVKHTAGSGQGQVGEVLSTPRAGNSTIQDDAAGMLDILRSIMTTNGWPSSFVCPIWRNSCWVPGDTSTGFTCP